MKMSELDKSCGCARERKKSDAKEMRHEVKAAAGLFAFIGVVLISLLFGESVGLCIDSRDSLRIYGSFIWIA